ncbi:Dual specificity phosphatase, catalytic domain [Shimia gijangensis]|uniref:Dual specificity phosphatase, catalytic domain n=1 Tax=Shimia gijangensis TaxID=1470563 RepID=A0A1M6KHS2_9RHOB|nr:dual specificity protein phosphatase family protein [Shimia gijangensis]SHJ58460.1 Dual specificity phosphatase, catalytic domain [Shimia gijangensis]
MNFVITSLSAGRGVIGICPAPGRYGDFAADLDTLLAWQPALVLSVTELAELDRIGAESFPDKLAHAGIEWAYLPIRDFGAPEGKTLAHWPETSQQVRATLDKGGRVLVHCFGGCGRSGMAILRLLVEMGENGAEALNRLRVVRPCAVETEAQMQWALHL